MPRRLQPHQRGHLPRWGELVRPGLGPCHASADAARTYLLFWLGGDIETAEKYLDLFCKKTDTAKQYVQKWLPIVAASQSVKGKAEEREFLMHWVNVVEYE